jgi:DNA-directed RNA polymerase specialized sigma24 family protein
MEKKTKKTKHYVNNKAFFDALVIYKTQYDNAVLTGEALPRISEYIGLCIEMICNRLAFRPNFINYSYQEELARDGIENCFAAINNFDPSKSNNPFAYFTSIAWNAFIRRIDRETAQHYTKHKNLENMFIMTDELYTDLNSLPRNGQNTSDNEGLQRHYDVIRKFEERLARKKEKARQSGIEKLLMQAENELTVPKKKHK